ncbi:MAG: PolC-type DNA polymerase III [Oscillospiraceae bacterium]|nr:PolC-type DNA polymerase III [Oscillospiraceae bacterium]
MSTMNPESMFGDELAKLGEDGELPGTFSGASVAAVRLEDDGRRAVLDICFDKPTAPVDIAAAESALVSRLGLESVKIKASLRGGAQKKKRARVIFGKPHGRGKVTPIGELAQYVGKAAVRGEVFDEPDCRQTKTGAWLLSFYITDYTGSLHVRKFLNNDKSPSTESAIRSIKRFIKPGVYLTVSGELSESKYDNGEIVMRPDNIETYERPVRSDGAESKRVELHLHTRMSAMDALTDAEAAVKRAIEWGHTAVAITDHGVVQSFPEAMKAAGDRIKVIYGVEGYYLNDVDGRPAVFGAPGGSARDEIVVFDIETTGLSARDDAITEIGAVIMRDGRETERFHTFADPDRPIPPDITRLTGIRDSDVAGAPSQMAAVTAFLEFAGDRTLAAHNAPFDIGFIHEVCRRGGVYFSPVYIDTLTLSRSLFPEFRRHGLSDVAGYLGLPSFNHHRAVDDAAVTGMILTRFFKELSERGVTELASINGHLSDSDALLSQIRKGNFRPNHIILLARTQAGIRNLYTLITKSHLEFIGKNPIIPKSELMRYREGLIIGSACEAGEVFRRITDGAGELELRRIAEFYDYLEIQPLCNNYFMLAGDRPRARDAEQLREFNRRVVELGKKLGKPVVATGDVHFLEPEHEIYRQILLTSKGYGSAGDPTPLYFRTTDEMLEEFAYLGRDTAYEVVVTNSRAIADMCDTVRPLPPAKKLFAPKLEGSAEELRSLVYGRLRELYGDVPPGIVSRRVETEMRDILDRNYDVIYMTAQKLVADSMSHGYLVGSRGSVGSSVAAFLAGITEVNALPSHYRCPECRFSDFDTGHAGGFGCGADMPDKACPVCGRELIKDGFDIPFETFLGFGGDKVPDIDLNFSGEYQQDAHRYTNEIFGADHVFRAGTIGTIAFKTAYGYVKNYLEKTQRTVSAAEERRLALGCVGVKRTTGQHPGGLIVIPQDMEIVDFCPAQHPADDTGAGVVTTHFDYHCMEENLLKLDELGHDDPTMLKILEDMTRIDAREIRLDDPETMAIFTSPGPLGLPLDDAVIGDTGSLGIPEFGTGFTRQMLSETKPDKFDTLVRLSGFSHGTNVWTNNARDIIRNGTAGIGETIGCRDDIMLYLISKGMDEKAAFQIMESVRKGKGLPGGTGDDMRRLGVPEWYIESCGKIEYLFPKAHAVAYVMMAFRIAWFKVHKPLEFYGAYFYRRSQKDAFDAAYMARGLDPVRSKIRAIRDMMGVKKATAKDEDMLTTLEVCYEFYMRGFEFADIDLYKSDAVKFKVTDDGRLRPPFVSISGLGEIAAREIADKRQALQFISVEDLAAYCSKVSAVNVEQLRELGAFADMPESSQMSLF